MNEIDLSGVQIKAIITHKVGNALREEPLFTAQELSAFDPAIEELLLTYYLDYLNPENLYQTPGAQEENGIHQNCIKCFEDNAAFIEQSQLIAQELYACGQHPNIKSGYLQVVLFDGILIDGQLQACIGLFKSDNSNPYLSFKEEENKININAIEAYALNGLDKACLIFDGQRNEGLLSIILERNANNNVNKTYWRDEFLQLQAAENAYHQTAQSMQLCQAFIHSEEAKELALNKQDEIGILQKGKEFFKNNNSFEIEQFEEQIFEASPVKEAFQEFKERAMPSMPLNIAQNFDISPNAVKKYNKVFKSVLKLDKNFHVYIHGDRNKIEQGTEEDGRKFYKLYYDEEK